jgi:organic radical activating enzyme
VAEYILYTDRKEDFVCEVDVKNASLKNSTSRIILETDDISYVFNGHIKDGKCTVPIRKMKGMLNEGDRGTMKLEIIVEDVYFSPWSSPFVVNTEKKMSVKVMEQIEKKPTVIVKEVVMPKKSISIVERAANDLQKMLSESKISKTNIRKQKKLTKEIFNSYFKEHTELKTQKHSILKTVLNHI